MEGAIRFACRNASLRMTKVEGAIRYACRDVPLRTTRAEGDRERRTTNDGFPATNDRFPA
jgi:hypothetical protein